MLNDSQNFLILSTAIDCPNRCRLCPQEQFVSSYSNISNEFVFSLEKFKYILDTIPKYVAIRFSGNNEPYMNPNCTEMIKYCIDSKREVHLFTTLNHCNNKDIDYILSIQDNDYLHRLVVHLPDNQENFVNTILDNDIYRNYIIKIKNEFKNLNKLEFVALSNNSMVHESLQDLFPNPVQKDFEIDSRCGLVFNSRFMYRKFYCSKSPNYTGQTLFPNGNIYFCVNDWTLKHYIGNIFEQSYEEILNSPYLKELVNINNTRGTIQNKTICGTCYYAKEILENN